jgi:hypothetical protein
MLKPCRVPGGYSRTLDCRRRISRGDYSEDSVLGQCRQLVKAQAPACFRLDLASAEGRACSC